MMIVQVFRKPHERFFSIESVFERVNTAWPDAILPIRFMLPVSGISLKNIRAARRAARENPGAIFHITGDAHYTIFALPRKRTLLTVHDAVFLEQHHGWKRWVLKKILLDLPVRYSKYISTISEKSKAEILRHTGCAASKIRVIPNPVSSVIQYQEQPFDARMPRLLFIGVKPNKNLERTAAALEGLPCKLVIIGKLFPQQVAVLEKHQVSYESMHGISAAEIARQFALADLILFPSLYEGFGLPVIEGFRAGRAVVTSNLSPMKDVAAGGACLVDPYDVTSIRAGLEKVIRDDGYRSTLVQRGFEVVQHYAPEHIAQQYFALYREIESQACVA